MYKFDRFAQTWLMMWKPTNAMFFNAVNVESGSIVAMDNMSPAGTVARIVPQPVPPPVLPDLRKWSDDVWIQYVLAARKEGKANKKVCIGAFDNESPMSRQVRQFSRC